MYGCTSVDISLETIVQIVNDIKVGKNGTGMLMTATGTYLAGVDSEKIAAEANILDEANASLAAAGNIILNNEAGITTYESDSGKMNLYYTTGRIDFRAKLPNGTGIWPALWMLPNENTYGTWASRQEGYHYDNCH
ncbi:MAG: family 16 glycosylhydrolase [Lachnospiraceae bacterium]|nr:family 16 glycosylhydrolase [Lachnospiraceae bacterium]